jgi:hypothetical protein
MLLLFGCGSQDPKPRNDPEENDGARALLPWKVGNRWTYRVTSDEEVTTKTTLVEAEELVGGSGPNKDTLAFRVLTTKGSAGSDKTVSYQALLAGKVVRYREQAFHQKSGELEQEEHWAPYKLHVDGTEEHTRAAADWFESYEETKLPVNAAPVTKTARDHWSVVSTNERVTVPAGTFEAVVLRKVGSSSVKQYWYARGVGKVKETGGQLEELTSFEVAP